MGSDGRDDESSDASSTDYDRYIDFASKKNIIKRFMNRPYNNELTIETNGRMRKVNNRSVTRRRARQH